jgi:hypothetical protein
MATNHGIWTWSCTLVAAALSACAPSASNLQPDRIPVDHGALFGRVRVWSAEDEVTGSCYLELTDDEGQRKANLSLDESGWVFTSVTQGHTHLGSVRCVEWNGLSHTTYNLDFDVAGGGRITYFGHVQFRLAEPDAKARKEFMERTAVLTGARVVEDAPGKKLTIEETGADGVHRLIVEDRSDEAVHEYRARYRTAPRLVSSLAGQRRRGTAPHAGRAHFPAREPTRLASMPDITAVLGSPR